MTTPEIDEAQRQINAARDQAHTNIAITQGHVELAQAAAEASGAGSAQTATAEANRAGQQKALAEQARAGAESARSGAVSARDAAQASASAAASSASQAQVDVDAAIAALVDGSPEALDTLAELAAALGDDPNFATTVSEAIGLRAKTSDVNTALADKSDVGHTHPVSDLTASGTASSATYLRGDGSWATPANTTYAVPSQAEAEAGTATTGRAFSAQRVRQAIDARAVTRQGAATGLWIGTEATLPPTGTTGVLYVTTE